MSPFPLSGALPGMLANITPIDEVIRPDSDSLVAAWRDEGGSTSNIYQSVDEVTQSDTDYAKLRVANWILTECPSTTTRTLRFRLSNPSAPPNPYQTVALECRSRIVDPFSTGFTATVDVKIKEGTTNVRSNEPGNTVTTTFGNDRCSMSTSEINSVTDWNDLYAEMTWTVCADGVDADLDIYCSHVYLELVP
jgi:hypothetical protein